MSEQNAAEELQRLRAAALAVLEHVEVCDATAPQHDALIELRDAVLGTQSQDMGEQGDPSRHLVSLYRYEGTARFPIPLDQEAADIRRELAGDRAVDGGSARDRPRPVVLTELRAMIIGGLLQELAARLSPGAAFGPSPAGRKLAAVVTELSTELLDQTIVGRQ